MNIGYIETKRGASFEVGKDGITAIIQNPTGWEGWYGLVCGNDLKAVVASESVEYVSMLTDEAA